jgi:hypothetical protein
MPLNGMSEITFTGNFDNSMKEMSKKEPSVELITTVKVPRHEYALLVAAKAKLDIIDRVCGNMDAYQTKEFLRALFASPTEEDAE